MLTSRQGKKGRKCRGLCLLSIFLIYLGAPTFSITTLSLKVLYVTLGISDTSIIDTQHYNIATLLIVAFFAIMLNVFRLSVVMLNVVALFSGPAS